MIINKFNIEKWMFDYFEDNLTVHEKIEFERFLEANPQFEDELQFWEDSYSSITEYPVYEIPSSLLKSSVISNRTIFVSIGVLLILMSSIGYYSILNLSEGSEKDLKLSELGEGVIEKRLNRQKEFEPFVVGTKTMKQNKEELKRENKDEKSFNSKSVIVLNSSKKEQTKSQKTIGLLFKSSKKEPIDHNINLNRIERSNSESSLYSNYKEGMLETEKHEGKLKIKSKKMLVLNIPDIEQNVELILDENLSNKSEYNYLAFKRNQNQKKRKKLTTKNNKTKERDRVFWDNFALIGNVFYNKNEKSKKIKKSKFLNSLKNKELALTNTHDPIFIKVNSNPVENNLALVGGLEMTRIKANVSNRWRSSYNEQNRGLISVDTYLKKLNSGVGVTAFSAQLSNSSLKTSSFGVTYSQRMQLKENSSINIGVKYDYNVTENNNLNTDNITPLEFEQNRLMSFSSSFNQEIKSVSHNLSTAIWYDGQFLYGGINLDNIKTLKKQNNNANEFAEYINPFKFAIQLGTDYRRNVYSALIISPQINYSYELNRSDLWLGSSLKYKHFVTGIGVSLSNAYKVNMGIQGDRVRLIYAFDISKSKAESKFYGTHEVSFRYLLRGKNSWN